jgi:hypothetical protein
LGITITADTVFVSQLILQDGGKFAPGKLFPAFCSRLCTSDHFLQDRLREHAEAFDGLLSLIPAKFYYGEDTSVRVPSFHRVFTNISDLISPGPMEEEETDKRASSCGKKSKARP